MEYQIANTITPTSHENSSRSELTFIIKQVLLMQFVTEDIVYQAQNQIKSIKFTCMM